MMLHLSKFFSYSCLCLLALLTRWHFPQVFGQNRHTFSPKDFLLQNCFLNLFEANHSQSFLFLPLKRNEGSSWQSDSLSRSFSLWISLTWFLSSWLISSLFSISISSWLSSLSLSSSSSPVLLMYGDSIISRLQQSEPLRCWTIVHILAERTPWEAPK